MTPDKLKSNLKKLRWAIARNPSKYTPAFTITVLSSFTKHLKTSEVNLLLAINDVLFEHKWPFPAYLLGSRWAVQKFSFALLPVALTQKARSFFKIERPLPVNFQTISTEELNHEFFRGAEKLMFRLFLLHEREVFAYWETNHSLQDKQYLINNIRSCYKKELWYACITSAFPILDFLCRKYVNTNHLDQDIPRLVACFKEAGVLSRNLKSSFITWDASALDEESASEAEQNDLRLVGSLLGSFLDFASIYYTGNRKDEGAGDINRYAIIHCASPHLWTRENATKVLVFIDLTLRLEPTFKILLKED